ncbi:hypothetical protein [Cellulomonas iranensis]|uniref:hypothetical protein n=1 Tax=Cellulomonas iranensis TaxID=76862 RepID=UPI0015C66B6C|nr:hypothetical protein [Cellulomonas iranensis]
MNRTQILAEVARERVRQTQKHGDQSRVPDGTGPDVMLLNGNGASPLSPDGTAIAQWLASWAKRETDHAASHGAVTFRDILLEEVFEALAEADPTALRTELVQVAAVAVQWIEAIDARALAGTEPLVVAPPATSPDCRVGKCRACSGDAWGDERDVLVPCAHDCHGAVS